MAVQCEKNRSVQKWVETTWLELSPQIYKLCVKKCGKTEDAKDLFQDIALKFCKNAEKLMVRDKAFPWLIVVSRSCWSDMVEKKHSTFAASTLRDEPVPYDVLSENRSVFHNEKDSIAFDFDHCFLFLSPVERFIIKLMCIGRASCDEVAGILGLSTNSVRKRKHRAMKKIRAKLQEPCNLRKNSPF